MQQRGAKLVLAGFGVLLDESDVLERSQESVDGAFRQTELTGEIDDAKAARAPREQSQDGRCALN
ncbi:MAG: hypothetical protein WAL63_04720 [Solirubrobacteraceae bacterium]